MVMAEILPLYYPPLDVIQPHDPMGDVQSKIFTANSGCHIQMLWLF